MHHLINDLLPPRVKLPDPFFSINKTIEVEKFVPSVNAVNIDFSLFKSVEKDQMRNPYIIYLRTDFTDNQLSSNDEG